MRLAVRLTAQAWVSSLALLMPLVASAQFDDVDTFPAAEPERGCPKRPDVVPFTARNLVGLTGSGWLAHQAIIPESKDRFFTETERDRSGVKLVPEDVDVRKLGAPDPSVPLWVFGKADSAACRAVPVVWWAVRMGTDADRKTYLMSELKVDCDVLPPGRLSGTPVALRQKDAPTGCKLRRADDNSTSEEGRGLPLELSDVIPERASCEAPECQRKWEIFSSRWDDGSAVFDIAVSWMKRDGKKDPCEWATEDHTALLLRPAGALAPLPMRSGGAFFGALYDSTGLRTVLSRTLGVLNVHDAAKPKVAPKAVRYGSPTEEELAHGKRTLSPCKK
ncbi:hypothetical protein [Myxococcus xanthus]|uniref:Lipoprotein n=1 Tax=Myxococcus xanthus TaxID=34 RepID=A0AAE6FWK3_MYXXA|nr:hypothetical protein [Myxococcus xanthus]QDE66672.1 hypothetical protein BHS09_06420 [Myxococcus xanthus]QDE73945.1 hypothetical protein BHS08_06425 [Myxococcus xanthus]QDE95538.1 hypothetical protein BHS05_06435 [Myxococcus xanthus]